MSDSVVRSYHDGDGRSGQSMHSYQSVKMAHSTQTSYRAAPHVHNCMSLHLENNNDPNSNKPQLLSELEIESDISPSAKAITEAPEAGTVRMMGRRLTSSKNTINEVSDCQPFPMFRLCQNISRESQHQIKCNIEYKAHRTVSYFPPVLSVVPPATENSPRKCRPEGVSQIPEELVNSPKIVGDGRVALTGSSRDNVAGPTQMVPCRLNRGKSPMSSSFMNSREELHQLSSVFTTKEQVSNINFTTLGNEHVSYQDRSALLVCENKLDNRSSSVNSGTSFLRKSNACQLLQDPFAGMYQLPTLVEERCQKMQSYSGTGFCSNLPEATKSERLYRGCNSLQKIADSVHDVDTMRICTMNPVEGLSGDPGSFSQTTHSFLFMKKTDVNPSEEKQKFRESKLSAKLKGKMFGELSLSPPMGQYRQRSKFQPLDISAQSDFKDNVEGVQTPDFHLKNESSAETDAMDMDAFKEQSYLSGANSFPSNKDVLVDKNPLSQSIIASLPDINKEIPVLQMDNTEPSTSKTQSLDAENLLSLTELPSKTKSSHSLDVSPRIEPSGRWLKRLKLSVSDSLALNTKSSNMGEALSPQKANKLFSRIMNSDEKKTHDQTSIVLRNGGPSSEESPKKGRDILLSHPWIQRWCHNRPMTHLKKPKAAVVCEPESTKVEFNELQNKQFPSVAAMALMGKAMRGFQHCEFQKRDSFVVWSTKGL
ncbi:hypothetical protein U1Q18_034855 [Sarracenia purpurea var. burkii]